MPLRKWTKEKVASEAALYASRTEFCLQSHGAYCAAKKSRWVDDVCAHMEPKLRRWTDADLRVESSKYKSRGAFFVGSQSAYVTARNRGILAAVCAHMAVPRKLKGHYVYTITRRDDRIAYVGQSVDPKARYAEHRRRPGNAVLPLIGGPHELEVIGGPYPSAHIRREENEAIRSLRSRGWLVTNQRPGGGLGAMASRWTLRRLRSVASKFDRRSDFTKHNEPAYAAARRMGVLDDVCSHMTVSRSRKPRALP